MRSIRTEMRQGERGNSRAAAKTLATDLSGDDPPPTAVALPPHRAQCSTSGGCYPVKRMKVVTLTAMAPITEKIICQVADGMAI